MNRGDVKCGTGGGIKNPLPRSRREDPDSTPVERAKERSIAREMESSGSFGEDQTDAAVPAEGGYGIHGKMTAEGRRLSSDSAEREGSSK